MTSQALAKPRTGRRGFSRSRTRAAGFYLFIAPWLIGLIALGVFPMVMGFIASFTNYDGFNIATTKFIGLNNYARMFRDRDVLWSTSRTLLWMALNVPMWLIGSFVLALALNQKIKLEGVFRTLLYLPSIIPLTAAVWVWKIFLDANSGLLNAIISEFRPDTAIKWLSDYTLPALTFVSVWGGLGGGMIIFLAGLQNIPDELKEAARIDGANSWKVFRGVTLPLMTPVIFFQLLLSIIGALQTLAAPLALVGGGRVDQVPPRDVYLFVVHAYRQIFVYQRFGYGLALIWVISICILILTLIVTRTSNRWVYYETAVEEVKE